MEILTGEQMRRVDDRAIRDLGIPGLLLMESAGRGVAESLLGDYPDLRSRGVVILCGKGNNGGDGIVAARHLARAGVVPSVLLLGAASELSGDAAVQLVAARGSGLEVVEVRSERDWELRRTILSRPGVVVVDAMLGTGVRGGARGLTASAIADLLASKAEVVSVDLPSGLDADSGAVPGPAVAAVRTYTMCRPKLPLVVEPAAALAGTWKIVPIGVPDSAVAEERADLEWLDADSVRPLLPPREPASHKGTYGHLLAVAGSRGKSGAAVLLGRAALRCGVGLVTVASPASSQPVVAAQQAELMTEPLEETARGGAALGALGRVLDLMAGRDALAVGPGLGPDPETARLVLEVVARRSAPAVLDADGLNAVAASGSRALSSLGAGPQPLALTPHPGEAARLLGSEPREIQKDRLGAARRLARETGAVVVLKGHRTVVATPDGRASINSTGNPGMATAGMGDVLTGMLGAFLARGIPAADAARLSVFLHGAAGDLAAARLGQEALMATDAMQDLPEAIRALAAGSEEREW